MLLESDFAAKALSLLDVCLWHLLNLSLFTNLLWTLTEYVLTSGMARQYFRNLKETGSPQSMVSLVFDRLLFFSLFVCLFYNVLFPVTVFACVSSGLSTRKKAARIPGFLRISARVSFINVSCQFFHHQLIKGKKMFGDI